jgi:hypothetical protein
MSKILVNINKQISLLNNSEINSVIHMIKNRRDELSSIAKSKFYPGQTVTFSGRGMTVKGVIRKLNPKTAVVAEPNHGNPKRWKVSLNLLEAV